MPYEMDPNQQEAFKYLSSHKVFKDIFFDTVLSSSLSGGRLVLGDRYDYKKCFGDNPVVIIAAAPKTGSTYLSNVLTKLLDYSFIQIHTGWGGNEHDFNVAPLSVGKFVGCISRTHTKGTELNATYIKEFGAKLLVTYRNIYDIVISLSKNLRNLDIDPNYGKGNILNYQFYWPALSHKNFNQTKMIDLVIDLILPWYINYYVSWESLCEEYKIDSMFISYEEMFSVKNKTILKILEFIDDSRVFTSDMLYKVTNKFYKNSETEHGEEGIMPIREGKKILSKSQIDKIKGIFSYYPEVDFSKYGI